MTGVIFPPSPAAAAKVLEELRRRATVREVKAKGTDEDEAELREWQRDVKRRSRERRKAA